MPCNTAKPFEAAAHSAPTVLLLVQGRAVLVRTEGRDWELVNLTRLKPEKARLVAEAATRGSDEKLAEHEILLEKVHSRFDAVGLRTPAVTVRFKALSVTAKVTVGNRGVPTLKSKLLALPKSVSSAALLKGRKARQRRTTLLDAVSGVLVPGRLTLLLGPPGSGKTILLRALCGLLKKDGTLSVTAEELTYNGRSLESFVPERTAAYISQYDTHYPELTVRETLDFSARCQGVGPTGDLFDVLESMEREKGIVPDPDTVNFMRTRLAVGKHNLMTSIMLRVLGLEHVASTVIGGPMLRGISGGQKASKTLF